MQEIKMQKKDNSNLLKPDRAVEDFLDALLQESTEKTDSLKPVRLERRRLMLMPELEISPQQPKAVDASEALAPEKVACLVEYKKTTVEAEVAPEPMIETIHLPENSPVIALSYQFPLQCLMFTVASNQLSIPLIDMGSVVRWGERLTQLPGSPDWFLGLMNYRDQNIRVADSAKILSIRPLAETPVGGRHLLVFGDASWAITCDSLGQVVYLSEEDVQWSRQGGRGLSLGTIKKSLAMLLDPKKILDQLNRQDDKQIA